MTKRTWDTEQFIDWMAVSGLSAAQAAVVLGIAERSVKRMRSGGVEIKNSAAERAQEWLLSTRVTTGTDALNLDSAAEIMDFAAICAANPLAHITCMTSAIARGWTAANANNWRQLAQPERMPQPTRFGRQYDLQWFSTSRLPWGVECRVDSEGRPYRIASPERTIIELAVHGDFAGLGDEVAEAVQSGVDFLARDRDRDQRQIFQLVEARSAKAAKTFLEYVSTSWRESNRIARAEQALED